MWAPYARIDSCMMGMEALELCRRELTGRRRMHACESQNPHRTYQDSELMGQIESPLQHMALC